MAAEAGGYFAYSLYDDCIYQEGVRILCMPTSYACDTLVPPIPSRFSSSPDLTSYIQHPTSHHLHPTSYTHTRRYAAVAVSQSLAPRPLRQRQARSLGSGLTKLAPLGSAATTRRMKTATSAPQGDRPPRRPLPPIPPAEPPRAVLHMCMHRCAGSTTVAWVNATAVRKALHVPLDSYFFNGDNGAGMTYQLTEKDLRPFYQQVAASTQLRVLIYNGDTDPSIDSFKAQNWTANLGLTPDQTWRPWTLDGCRRMGGYVTRCMKCSTLTTWPCVSLAHAYAHVHVHVRRYKERFDYLTIRGAGHMVPQVHTQRPHSRIPTTLPLTTCQPGELPRGAAVQAGARL